jgi:hypothetical protein
MLRRVLFALAGIAVAALLAADRAPKASAADPEVTGNWVLTYSPRGGSEQALAIVKVETTDGKPSASVLFASPQVGKMTVSKFEADGKTVKFATSLGFSFEGTVGKDGKVALGNFSSEQASFRAKLSRTDKTELAASELNIKTETPAPVTDVQKLNTAVLVARNTAAREKDEDKKKELVEKADAAQKEADEKVPGLLRTVVAEYADTPFALDAASDLLRGGAKYKLTSVEAAKLVALVEKQSTEFGPRFANTQMLSVLESLATQKGLEGAAEAGAAKLAKTAGPSAEFLSRVLSVRKTALEALGKTAEAKTIADEIAKLEERIDKEYVAKVPPFKPAAFAGRKDTSANKVVVMELFTGAQCPPCVAADVAFDALQKSYKPTELVLIQYHMHIPGPDPLTNPASVARWDYYSKEFPDDIRGTPSTLFNGKPQARGGGGMGNAEGKYKQYTGIIDPLLEKSAEVKVAGKASRAGDKLEIAVEVTGGDGDDMRLRLLVVEENVKYVGGNQLRFHHQVVRAMPDGADGVAIKDKAFKHTAKSDLGAVRKDLTTYLDDFAKNRPFPKPERPMDMKAVRVIALIQNDKTKEIVQAAQIEVGGQTAGGGGR